MLSEPTSLSTIWRIFCSMWENRSLHTDATLSSRVSGYAKANALKMQLTNNNSKTYSTTTTKRSKANTMYFWLLWLWHTKKPHFLHRLDHMLVILDIEINWDNLKQQSLKNLILRAKIIYQNRGNRGHIGAGTGGYSPSTFWDLLNIGSNFVFRKLKFYKEKSLRNLAPKLKMLLRSLSQFS